MLPLVPILALFAQVPANFDGSMMYDLAHGPVKYNQTAKNEITAYAAPLRYEPQHGYLLSLLKGLKIPVSSQTLVFSKTSFQAPMIFPHAPRAIFFNDDTYVGWVKGADYLEISTADPQLGAVFYVLEQEPRPKPRFERHDDCLQCHHSARTSGVPGHIVRSVYTQPNGQMHTNTSSYITDQRSPMAERWGGWYVSGTVGFPHLGNQFFSDPETGRTVKPFDSPAWPAQTSDVVAHLVLTHQVTGHNYLARLNYEARAALDLQHVMNEMDRKPDVEASWSESTRRRITTAIEAAVRYLTYADEAQLPGAVAGDSSFQAEFEKQHPLKKLNLKTRVFEYPLSYLIESRATQALPEVVRTKLLARLEQVLTREAGKGSFSRLDPQRAGEAWQIYRNAHPGD